jgi:REP element-mobilizing transposase RayT
LYGRLSRRQTEPIRSGSGTPGRLCKGWNKDGMRYFITLACDGAHLHGDEGASVDRRHNLSQRSARTAVGLLAAHVRTNHVHVIVEAEVPLEKVMNDFEAYASRALSRLDGNEPGRRRWARHGSTRWLWRDRDVAEAIRYVVVRRGEAMQVFLGGCALRPANPGSVSRGFSYSRAQLYVAPRTDLA